MGYSSFLTEGGVDFSTASVIFFFFLLNHRHFCLTLCLCIRLRPGTKFSPYPLRYTHPVGLWLVCFLGHIQKASVKDAYTENCILMLLDMFFHILAYSFKISKLKNSHVFAPSMHFIPTIIPAIFF